MTHRVLASAYFCLGIADHRFVSFEDDIDPDQISLIQATSRARIRTRENKRAENAHVLNHPWSELSPAQRTAGGGFEGGWLGHLAHAEMQAQPAPPMEFPAGCQWRAPQRVALIHIGRSAGTSIRVMMHNTPIQFTHDHGYFHQKYFSPGDYDLFVITTRDPVERVISAFNWRHPIGGGADNSLSAEEKELYSCFPGMPGGVNKFAEALDDKTTCGSAARRCLHSPSAGCRHISWNIRFYLSTGLEDRTQDLLGHLRHVSANSTAKVAYMLSGTKDLVGQMAKVYDWLCVPPELRSLDEERALHDYERRNDTYLSPEGYRLLREHLDGDYHAMEELTSYAFHQ